MPTLGYSSTFYMPIIEPPPPGTDPSSHYATVTKSTAVRVTQVANHGLKIGLSNPAFRNIFAMGGGLVTFIPAGSRLPTAGQELSPGAGSVILQTHYLDVNELKKVLPPGVPPMTSILYLNVRPDSVRSALDPHVRALSEPVLRGAWDLPSSPANRTVMENRYLDRLLIGQTAVFLTGGTTVGEAEHGDPNNPSSDIELTLRFTDGAGDDLSPILHLRSMPSYGGTRWTDHPLVNALVGLPVPVNVHLQFEVWNEASKVFETLPAGIAIDLMEYEPVSPNDVLATQHTNSQGRVHFSFANLQAMAGETPDIFFRARPAGRSHAGHTLPDEWSTKGWSASDGSPGYYEDFIGTQLGDATSPLVFRVGLDFHARFEYRHERKSTALGSPYYDVAPKGIPVSLYAGGPPGVKKKDLRTDANGEVHGVTFDVEAEENIHFRVQFEIEDADIHLPRSRVQMDPRWWSTYWDDADNKYFPDNDLTSIGTQGSPKIFRCTVDDRNVALYFLKTLRELSTFLFHITGGAWTGVDDLVMFRTSISNHPYSWPVGHVNIPPRWHWDRETLMHELGHQIMWKEANFSSAQIALEFGPGGELHGLHDYDFLLNEEHALIEGWAQFLAIIFEEPKWVPEQPHLWHRPEPVRFPYSLANLKDEDEKPVGGLGPPPNNRGESVEGAFVNGLWAIFEKHVVTPSVSGNARVKESSNGDVTQHATWLTNTAVRDRFLSAIWNPLKDLKDLADPPSTKMFDNIRLRNPNSWHMLGQELQNYNMAMIPPILASISPRSGPSSGGQRVTLTGTNFMAGASVTIGSVPATNVVVASSTSLTADTPARSTGPANIVVSTTAGSNTIVGGYDYV